jgi:hypothetical protein
VISLTRALAVLVIIAAPAGAAWGDEQQWLSPEVVNVCAQCHHDGRKIAPLPADLKALFDKLPPARPLSEILPELRNMAPPVPQQ